MDIYEEKRTISFSPPDISKAEIEEVTKALKTLVK